MTITQTADRNQTIFALSGHLDTTTAPQLEAALKPILPSVTSLVLDFSALEYISSAGLRVLLTAQKAVNKRHAQMVIRHVNDTINEIFEVTGFADILTLE